MVLLVPARAWRSGQMMESDLFAVGNAMRGAYISLGIATAEQYDAAAAACRDEFAGRQCHVTFPFYIAYGQKM